MKKIIFFLVAILLTKHLFSQEVKKEESKKVEFKTIGSINISADTKQSLYLNFGGPNISFKFGKLGVAYGMFPSIRYFYGDVNEATNAYKTKTNATPILGTGITLYYKKLAVVLPMYYLPTNNVWIISGGVGYKF